MKEDDGKKASGQPGQADDERRNRGNVHHPIQGSDTESRRCGFHQGFDPRCSEFRRHTDETVETCLGARVDRLERRHEGDG